MILLPYDMPTYHPHPTHPHWRKVDGGFLDRLVITVNGKPVEEPFSWDQHNKFVRARLPGNVLPKKWKFNGQRIDLYGGTKYATYRLKGIVGVFKREDT